MVNKKSSTESHSHDGERSTKNISPTDLLIETIRSGVTFMQSMFVELKRVKEDTGCVTCQLVPKQVTDEFSRVSKKILELLNFDGDSNKGVPVISREEFDALKLEVIKLKSQLSDLSAIKAEK